MYMKCFCLILLVIRLKLFGAIQTNNQGYFDCLPSEVICKLIVSQEPKKTLKKQLHESFRSDELKRNILPCYQLLITCKKFYFNEIIKENLYKTMSNFSSIIYNYIFLNQAIKNQNFQELIITNGKKYLKDHEIDPYKLFFQNNLNKIISVETKISDIINFPTLMFVPEFLVSNLKAISQITSLKLGFNLKGIAFSFANHFSMLEYICLNGDLSLPCLSTPGTTIAQFLLKNLQDPVFIFKPSISIISQEMNTNYIERYKIRNRVNEVPEKILLDCSLLLSDAAFEKLQNAINNPEKKVLDKKLLNWILPELPAESTESFWHRYCIQKICLIYISFLNKINMLITMIQKSFYNHI